MRDTCLKAYIVKMPKKVTEEIWSVPSKIVDNRWLHERILNINTHKVTKTEDQGQRFTGRTTTTPGVFRFEGRVDIGIKIKQVETEGFLFYGVIPTEYCICGKNLATGEDIVGAHCTVDYFTQRE